MNNTILLGYSKAQKRYLLRFRACIYNSEVANPNKQDVAASFRTHEEKLLSSQVCRPVSGTAFARFAERELWNISGSQSALLRLDVGRPDHLAPLLSFVGDELAEVGGRH